MKTKIRITSKAVALLLFILSYPVMYTGGSADKCNTGFEIYLVKQGQEVWTEGAKSIPFVDELVLEETPLISSNDLLSYCWDCHSIKIKASILTERELVGRTFLVVADGERIYIGRFWSGFLSSLPYAKVLIYLDFFDENSPYRYLSLGSWLPGREINPDAKKIISDDRVKKVIERDGKLYELHKPVNLKRPDTIYIFVEGTNKDTGFDWEFTDKIIEAIDNRFVSSLDYIKQDLPVKCDELYDNDEIIVDFKYDSRQKMLLNTKYGKLEYEYDRLIMPLTGQYSNLLMLCKADYTLTKALGYLRKFNNINLIKNTYGNNDKIAITTDISKD
jgi:hypothetical protein